MVSSVLAFADCEGLLSHVADALTAHGATASDDGYISTIGNREGESALIYAITLSSDERAGLDRLTTSKGVRAPDLTRFDAVMIECRSADEVARLGRVLAARLFCELWFVDAADRAWSADEVDPIRLALT